MAIYPRRAFTIVATGLVLSLFMLFTGCGSGGGGGSSSGGGSTTTRSASVVVQNMTFVTSPLTVAPGTAVTWSNQSSLPHNIVWDSTSPSTSVAPGANLDTFTGGSTSAVWTAPAVTTTTTYNYHCGIHGLMMSGQIIVSPGATASAETKPAETATGTYGN